MCSMLTSPVSLTICLTAAIMRELSDVVADGNILQLVEKFLKAGSDGRRQDPADATSVRLKAASFRRCWPTSP